MGLFGAGSSGSGGISISCGGSTPGQGVSGGSDGLQLPYETNRGPGGIYGGGASSYGNGAAGAERVIWGEGRAFPFTNVGKNYGGIAEAVY